MEKLTKDLGIEMFRVLKPSFTLALWQMNSFYSRYIHVRNILSFKALYLDTSLRIVQTYYLLEKKMIFILER